MEQIHACEQQNSENISDVENAIKSWNTPSRVNISGLLNQGGTCYLNTLVQTLLHTQDFTRRLFSMAKEMQVTQLQRILQELLILFSRLFNGNGHAVSAKPLTDSFGWSRDEVFVHQDIQELNRLLFEHLEMTLKETVEYNLINDLYRGVLRTQVKCLVCGHQSERNDEFQDVNLSVSDCDSIEESLQVHTHTERLCGENQYFCENCKCRVDAIKESKFKELPPILTLSLSRFYFDATTMEACKLDKLCSFPLTLDMSDYLADSYDEAVEYELFSVVIHAGGTACGGHYHAFIKDPYGVVKIKSGKAELVTNGAQTGELIDIQTNTNSYLRRDSSSMNYSPRTCVKQKKTLKPFVPVPRCSSLNRYNREQGKRMTPTSFNRMSAYDSSNHSIAIEKIALNQKAVRVFGSSINQITDCNLQRPSISTAIRRSSRDHKLLQNALPQQIAKPSSSSKFNVTNELSCLFHQPKFRSESKFYGEKNVNSLVNKMRSVLLNSNPSSPMNHTCFQLSGRSVYRNNAVDGYSCRNLTPTVCQPRVINKNYNFSTKMPTKRINPSKVKCKKISTSYNISITQSNATIQIDQSNDNTTVDTELESFNTESESFLKSNCQEILTTSHNNDDLILKDRSSLTSQGSSCTSVWRSKLFTQTPTKRNNLELEGGSMRKTACVLSDLDNDNSMTSTTDKFSSQGIKIRNSLSLDHGIGPGSRWIRRSVNRPNTYLFESKIQNIPTSNSSQTRVDDYNSENIIYGKWFDFNDDAVTEVDSNNFDRVFKGSECAYMLFYKRLTQQKTN